MEIKTKNKKLKIAAKSGFTSDKKNTAWLTPEHPNFERWKRARDLSADRGKFVKTIVDKHIKSRNFTILDLGSGEGGTCRVFSKENKIISFDINLLRLQRQNNAERNIFKVNGNALHIPFKKNSFDLVILQDVIEHISFIPVLVNELKAILKQNGLIYLSTPNRFSLFNLIADPHWGFPVVSFFRRKTIKKYFLKYFRKNEISRSDIPELLSLEDIRKYFKNYFELKLETRHSVAMLLEGNKGIIWSNFHLNILKFIKYTKIGKMLLFFSNNKPAIINNFFTPTFYLIIRKIK